MIRGRGEHSLDCRFLAFRIGRLHHVSQSPGRHVWYQTRLAYPWENRRVTRIRDATRYMKPLRIAWLFT